jgi:hypothetical protein
VATVLIGVAEDKRDGNLLIPGREASNEGLMFCLVADVATVLIGVADKRDAIPDGMNPRTTR